MDVLGLLSSEDACSGLFMGVRWVGALCCPRCGSGRVVRNGRLRERVNHSENEYAREDVHINNCENKASILRPWLAVHRGICKDNLTLYPAAFKTCRRLRKMKPIKAIKETIKTAIQIITATKNPSKERTA